MSAAKPRLLVLSFDQPFVERLTTVLGSRFQLFHCVPQREAIARQGAATDIDICLLDSDDLLWDGNAHLGLLSYLTTDCDAAVVMMAGRLTAASVIDAVRAGARDICDKSAPPDELTAVIDGLLRRRPPTATGDQATVLTFLGARPGVGATTAALAVAQSIARRAPAGARVLFADFSSPPAESLDLVPVRPGLVMADAVQNIGRIDAAFIEDAVAHAADPPLYVLPLARSRSEAAGLTAGGLRLLLATLRDFFHTIVVDANWEGDTELAAQLFAEADRPVLCCSQSVPAIHGATAILNTVRERWGEMPASRLLVTRHAPRLFPGVAEIAEALGLAGPALTLVEERSFVETARNMAAPLVRAIPLTRFEWAADDLASQLLPDLPRHAPGTRLPLLARALRVVSRMPRATARAVRPPAGTVAGPGPGDHGEGPGDDADAQPTPPRLRSAAQ